MKIRKANSIEKEDIYLAISEKYGFTPDQIADMNPYQQYVYYRGPRIVKVDSYEQVLALQGKK